MRTRNGRALICFWLFRRLAYPLMLLPCLSSTQLPVLLVRFLFSFPVLDEKSATDVLPSGVPRIDSRLRQRSRPPESVARKCRTSCTRRTISTLTISSPGSCISPQFTSAHSGNQRYECAGCPLTPPCWQDA